MAQSYFEGHTARSIVPLDTQVTERNRLNERGWDELNKQLNTNQVANFLGGAQIGQGMAEKYYETGKKAQELYETKETAKDRIDRTRAEDESRFEKAINSRDYEQGLNPYSKRLGGLTGINAEQTGETQKTLGNIGLRQASTDLEAANELFDSSLGKDISTKRVRVGAIEPIIKAEGDMAKTDYTSALSGAVKVNTAASKANLDAAIQSGQSPEAYAARVKDDLRDLATTLSLGADGKLDPVKYRENFLELMSSRFNASQAPARTAMATRMFEGADEDLAKAGNHRAVAAQLLEIRQKVLQLPPGETPRTTINNILAGSPAAQRALRDPAASGLFGSSAAAVTDLLNASQKVMLDDKDKKLLADSMATLSTDPASKAAGLETSGVNQFARATALAHAPSGRTALSAATMALADPTVSRLDVGTKRATVDFILNPDNETPVESAAESVVTSGLGRAAAIEKLKREGRYRPGMENDLDDAILQTANHLSDLKARAEEQYSRVGSIQPRR